MLETKTVTNGPFAKQLQRACHGTLPWLISFSLDRDLLVGTPFERTNAALLRFRDEVQEFARRCTEFHRRGFFKRLRNVESAQVNKFECGFDFVSLLCAEASAAQSNEV
jgi:hypothetical protein